MTGSTTTSRTPLTLDVWVDLACPWCAVGERRLSAALEEVEFADEVDVRFRAYQLQPGAPEHSHTSHWDFRSAQGASDEYLNNVWGRLGEIGAAEDLVMDPKKAIYVNTRTAHRLIQGVADTGLQREFVDALFTAFFDGSVNAGENDDLQALADRVGIDPALTARILADPEEFADVVDRDLALAPQIGVSGVPFYVFADKYGVSGAQPVETLVAALEQVRNELTPATV